MTKPKHQLEKYLLIGNRILSSKNGEFCSLLAWKCVLSAQLKQWKPKVLLARDGRLSLGQVAEQLEI